MCEGPPPGNGGGLEQGVYRGQTNREAPGVYEGVREIECTAATEDPELECTAGTEAPEFAKTGATEARCLL